MGDLKKAKRLYQDGKNQSILRNHKRAIELYIKALNYEPMYFEAWLSLSNAYSELKQYEDAKDACKSALRIDQKNHLP